MASLLNFFDNNGNLIEIPALRGPEGPQGPKGDTGPQGPQGPQGLQGPKGDAANAYEVAQQMGYEGTVEDFMASLKGADGQNGRDGAQGPAGDSGAWHGTIDEFEALNSYSSTTIYFIYPPAQQTWTSGYDSNSRHILNIGDLTDEVTSITGNFTQTLIQQKEMLHAELYFEGLWTANSGLGDCNIIEITNPLLKTTEGTVTENAPSYNSPEKKQIVYDNIEDKFYISASGGNNVTITLDLPLDIFYAFRPYTVPNHSEVTAFKMIQSVTFREALNEYGITLELG